MSNNLWVAYTPNGPEFFPTEEEAKKYLKEILVSDNLWDEEYIPDSWLGMVIYKSQLKVIDSKEDHKCVHLDRPCSFRDHDGICTDYPHDDAIFTGKSLIEGCMEIEPWEHSTEFDFLAELEFIPTKEG